MARLFLTNVSLNANQLNNVALHPSTTAPSSPAPVTGSVWYDTSGSPKVLKIYNGATWDTVSNTGTTGISSVTGTTNQITATTASGAVTLSLPSAVTMPGSLTVTTDLTVTGNLTVSGTTTTVNSETVTINDNIVVLNNNAVNPPTENAGLRVYRGGTSTDSSIIWDETADLWKAGLAGAEVEISLLGHTHSQYATLASPTFTGTPAAPTAAADTNTTQVATTAFVIGQASSTNPVMDGTVSTGTSLKYARADHVHPSDTSRAPLASPALTGTPTAPTATAGTNSTQIATTAYVDTGLGTKAGKFAVSVGNASLTAITVTHNLGTKDVVVNVYDNTSFDTVECDVSRPTTNTVTLTFAAAPGTNAYRCVVLG